MTNDKLNMFLENMETERKSLKTIDRYNEYICDMLSFVKKSEEDIKVADLVNWKISMKKLSSATIACRIASVKSYFRFLKNMGFIKEDVSDNHTFKAPTIKNKPTEFIPFADAIDMIKATQNPREKAIIAVYLTTGIRVSELVNLTLSNIESDMIDIKVKGDKIRAIYINEDCKGYIKDYLKVRKASEYDNLFISNHGTPMNTQCLTAMLRKLARKIGANDKITNHSMRHTVVTALGNANGIASASQFVGHANVATTQRYFHTSKDDIKSMSMGLNLG